MLLSKLIHEIGGLHGCYVHYTIHLIGNGYDDEHRHTVENLWVCEGENIPIVFRLRVMF